MAASAAVRRTSRTSSMMGSPAAISNRGAEGWWNPSAESRTKLEVLFQMISGEDGDGGTISEPELAHMLRNLGEPCDEKLVEKMLDLVDLNGDRELDFEELYVVMTNTGDVGVYSQMLNTLHPLSLLVGAPIGPGRRCRPIEHLGNGQVGAGASGSTGSGGDKPEPEPEAGKYTLTEVRELFDAIDEDESGFLDKEEVSQLATKLNRNMKRRHLVDAMQVMDPKNTGKS